MALEGNIPEMLMSTPSCSPCVVYTHNWRVERAKLIVSTADFSLFIIIYFGRWTPPYRNVLRDSKYTHKWKFHRSSTKLQVLGSVVWLFVRDAAQQSSTHCSLCSIKLPKETCEQRLVRDRAHRILRLD